MTASVARTARDRARDEIRREIQDEARRQLAEVGPAVLSLRSVARALGMVSSAVYRYYRSRDDLLTALIVEAYDDLGAAAEAADAALDRGALMERWTAICHAVRTWARAKPHEYALIYGTPVPGYHAPADQTVPPAMRITTLLMAVLRDGADRRRLAVYIGDAAASTLPDGYASDLDRVRQAFAASVPVEVLARGFLAWTLLFGAVSFEVFGRLNNVVEDLDGYFDDQVRRAGALIGLQPA